MSNLLERITRLRVLTRLASEEVESIYKEAMGDLTEPLPFAEPLPPAKDQDTDEIKGLRFSLLEDFPHYWGTNCGKPGDPVRDD